jgi:signal transduction histidine kinase
MGSEPPASPSVLIVDDVAANRVALQAVLKPLEVRVVEASSGSEALEQVLLHAFAVVLLDVQMPEMDGFETAKRMRSLPNGGEVPIMFVTAIHRDEAHARRGYATGGADYITKPYDTDVVRARVRAFVDLFRQREEAHRARFESQSRERLYSVLEAVPAAISIWSLPDYVCEYANAEYRRSRAGTDPVGQTNAQQGVSPQVVARFEDVVRTRQSATLRELPMTWDWKGKGVVEERFFDLTVLPERQGEGKPNAVIVFAIDITESVRARKVVESARREAEIANRAKDEFLATVSHELRTPLNAILGWTSSARRGVVRDLDRALATVERSARAQARIIDDVLDVARIASGKLRLNIAPTDVRQAMFGAVEAVRPAAEAKGITLEIAVDDKVGMIGADADRLQQVVWNLLSNAVKFTPTAGRVRFDVTKDDASVVLSVMDTGEGIAPEFLPHVFELFRQADGSTTRRHQGLGLGLAIVKQLVVAHGGTIRAKSDGLGRGATFVAVLPARTAAALRPPPEHNGTADFALVAAAVRLDDVRVLLVDDEDDARQLAREVLTGHGAVVEEASSAQEALWKLGSFRPDVMVTDIGLPYTDGFSLIGHVRKLPPELGGQTPAIALTAYALAEDRDRALAAGFQLHVPKPVDPLELVSRIADLGPRKRVVRS